MDTGVVCRIRAADFLVQAKRDPERKTHLISMAESWLRLAVQADHIFSLENWTVQAHTIQMDTSNSLKVQVERRGDKYIWCPHCLISHQIMAKNAWVIGDTRPASG